MEGWGLRLLWVFGVDGVKSAILLIGWVRVEG